MAEKFLTADLHFEHGNILKFQPETRPWDDKEEMREALIESWNSRVGLGDCVYSLGDFAFNKDPELTASIINRLNGQIFYIRGNHYYQKNIDKWLPLTKNKVVWVKDYFELKHNKKKICLFHFPQVVWNSSHFGSYHAFGHCHGSYEGKGKCHDVGWDANNKLLHIDEFIEICDNKEIHTPSHHKQEYL